MMALCKALQLSAISTWVELESKDPGPLTLQIVGGRATVFLGLASGGERAMEFQQFVNF